MSNFLGVVRPLWRPSSILSAAELMAREGIMLQKSMNFRPEGDFLSVFLVLPDASGEYREAWDPKNGVYSFEGHDSSTIDTGGKSKDQLMMYGSGKLTDNGKFYKEAILWADSARAEPLQIQVYEKLDPGVWFDKGIFNLIDAAHIERSGKVFVFSLQPSDWERADTNEALFAERMMPAREKAALWHSLKGRCARCGAEEGLRFVKGPETTLLCAKDRGEERGGGFLG